MMAEAKELLTDELRDDLRAGTLPCKDILALWESAMELRFTEKVLPPPFPSSPFLKNGFLPGDTQ